MPSKVPPAIHEVRRQRRAKLRYYDVLARMQQVIAEDKEGPSFSEVMTGLALNWLEEQGEDVSDLRCQPPSST